MAETLSPKVSEVIAALEAIRNDELDPFIILETPWNEQGCSSFCQARAGTGGYKCEIRIYSDEEFRHSKSFLRDAHGCLGDKNDPQLPNLSQVIRIFTGFIADPGSLPSVPDLAWLDLDCDFEVVPE